MPDNGYSFVDAPAGYSYVDESTSSKAQKRLAGIKAQIASGATTGLPGITPGAAQQASLGTGPNSGQQLAQGLAGAVAGGAQQIPIVGSAMQVGQNASADPVAEYQKQLGLTSSEKFKQAANESIQAGLAAVPMAGPMLAGSKVLAGMSPVAAKASAGAILGAGREAVSALADKILGGHDVSLGQAAGRIAGGSLVNGAVEGAVARVGQMFNNYKFLRNSGGVKNAFDNATIEALTPAFSEMANGGMTARQMMSKDGLEAITNNRSAALNTVRYSSDAPTVANIAPIRQAAGNIAATNAKSSASRILQQTTAPSPEYQALLSDLSPRNAAGQMQPIGTSVDEALGIHNKLSAIVHDPNAPEDVQNMAKRLLPVATDVVKTTVKKISPEATQMFDSALEATKQKYFLDGLQKAVAPNGTIDYYNLSKNLEKSGLQDIARDNATGNPAFQKTLDNLGEIGKFGATQKKLAESGGAAIEPNDVHQLVRLVVKGAKGVGGFALDAATTPALLKVAQDSGSTMQFVTGLKKLAQGDGATGLLNVARAVDFALKEVKLSKKETDRANAVDSGLPQ